jgi:hypothetical protein
MKLDMEKMGKEQTQHRVCIDVLEDSMMDVEMSAQGAHCMIATPQDDVWDLNELLANLINQLEHIQVEDVSWCRSWITQLEKPNYPTNCSLWHLANSLSR